MSETREVAKLEANDVAVPANVLVIVVCNSDDASDASAVERTDADEGETEFKRVVEAEETA